MSNNAFPTLTLSGTAEQRGGGHGHMLASQVEDCIEFYARLFGRREQEIFTAAKYFRDVITDFNRDYSIEIEALAAAAKVDPLWVYALNARSEILNGLALECTAVFFPSSALLGQNWDWSASLESLVRLVTIRPAQGPDILMLTEPGIIGKIGCNAAGLGVCLNILSCPRPARGVPVHILLRAVLDSTELGQAAAMLKRAKPGRASHLMIGSAEGQYLSIEYAGTEQFRLSADRWLLHTNHYLGGEVPLSGLTFASSHERYSRAVEVAGQLENRDIEGMQHLLSDQTKGEMSICSPYHRHEILGECGTVCTLIMELEKRQLYVKRGNRVGGDFNEYSI